MLKWGGLGWGFCRVLREDGSEGKRSFNGFEGENRDLGKWVMVKRVFKGFGDGWRVGEGM